MTYLGHIVSSEGVATDHEKTAVIQAWTAPQNVRQVRSFLGLVGYYQRYIPAFAKNAAPLHGLLRGMATTHKTAPIHWTTDCEQAFQQLKEALVSPPILAYADFNLPFRLYTDASLEGLGAVLAQVQNGKERVIAYASRSLHPPERNNQNYSSFKLELLALKWAMTDKFKDYLWGMEVEVFTDNNPLVHLETVKLGVVEQRWAAQLANFKYTIRYHPGTANHNTEVLSRLPGEQQVVMTRLVGAQSTEGEDSTEQPVWYTRQREDPDLSQLLSWKQQGQPPPVEEQVGLSVGLQQFLCEWDQIEVGQDALRRVTRTEGHMGESCSQILVPSAHTKTLWHSPC